MTVKKKIAILLLSLLVSGMLVIGVRTVTRPSLKYFSAQEFGVWFPLMSAELLIKLDAFRHAWGAPVEISPAEGGIGREDESNSQHNVSAWGEVRAIDVMPRGMSTEAERRRAVAIAKEVGFTGIGIYPDWKPRAGLHLDVRKPQSPGHVATWSGIKNHNGKQVYASLERGLV